MSNNSSSTETMPLTIIHVNAQRTKLVNLLDANATCQEILRIKEQLHWSLHCLSRHFIMDRSIQWKVKRQVWRLVHFAAVAKSTTKCKIALKHMRENCHYLNSINLNQFLPVIKSLKFNVWKKAGWSFRAVDPLGIHVTSFSHEIGRIMPKDSVNQVIKT